MREANFCSFFSNPETRPARMLLRTVWCGGGLTMGPGSRTPNNCSILHFLSSIDAARTLEKTEKSWSEPRWRGGRPPACSRPSRERRRPPSSLGTPPLRLPRGRVGLPGLVQTQTRAGAGKQTAESQQSRRSRPRGGLGALEELGEECAVPARSAWFPPCARPHVRVQRGTCGPGTRTNPGG